MPENDNLIADFDELALPNGTWQIDFERNLITTRIDDLEAIHQAVILILNTERYKFQIFSHQYGVELVDLFGENHQYVMSELKRRIRDALLWDERISSVENFEYTRTKRGLHVSFTVVTNVGSFEEETEVAL